MHFQFDYLFAVMRHTTIFGVVRYVIEHLFYKTASSTGCPKKNATCLTERNFAFRASNPLNDDSF